QKFCREIEPLRDRVPRLFELLHVVAREGVGPKTHVRDASHNETGLEYVVAAEREAGGDGVQLAHRGWDLLARVTGLPLRGRDTHQKIGLRQRLPLAVDSDEDVHHAIQALGFLREEAEVALLKDSSPELEECVERMGVASESVLLQI